MNYSDFSGKSQIRSVLDSNWIPFLILGLFILVLILGRLILDNYLGSHQMTELPSGPALEKIQQVTSDVLVAHEVRWESRVSNHWKVQIPADLPSSDLYVSLQESIIGIGAEVIHSYSNPMTNELEWDIGWADSCLLKIQFIPADYKRETGRIALLIDDFGDRNDAFAHSFFDLEGSITISVIPGLVRSKAVAEAALAQGCELVIHLPMEPLQGDCPKHGFTIITEMSQENVENVFHKAFRELPGASGVNNHMGSKVTADRRIMGYLMNAIKSEGLYFLDSRTTAATVAYETALAAGIRCGQRDVFIDNDSDKESIRRSISMLAADSEKNGMAIGIGHCYRNTLEVLREEIPKLKARGFRFIRISEAVR